MPSSRCGAVLCCSDRHRRGSKTASGDRIRSSPGRLVSSSIDRADQKNSATPTSRTRACADADGSTLSGARHVGGVCETKRAIHDNGTGRQGRSQRGRERNQLERGNQQRSADREIERRPLLACDPRPNRHRERQCARRDRHGRPEVSAAEGEQRPAREQREDDAAGGRAARRLRRSSSCTGGRSSANSSTCCGRNRPCSARPPRTSARAGMIVSSARSASRRRVISAPITNVTPETSGARITASVTASTGGVSITIQSNGPCDRFVEQRLHALRREQLGWIRRRLAGGDRQQVRIDRALDDVAHARLADQHLRQPALVRQPQRTVQAGTAHVGVDQQHARRRRTPAPSRCWPPSSSCLRAAARW